MESSLIFASVGWWWLNSNFFSRPSIVGAHVLRRLFIPASGGRGYAHTSPDSPSSALPWPPLPPSLDPAGEAWLFLPFLPLWLRGRRGGGSEPCRPRWSSSSIYCRAAALSSGPDPLAARTHHNQSILPPPAPAAFAVVPAFAVLPVAHVWRGNKMSEKGN